MERAVAVGRLLAEVLIAREQVHCDWSLIAIIKDIKIIFIAIIITNDVDALLSGSSTCDLDWF